MPKKLKTHCDGNTSCKPCQDAKKAQPQGLQTFKTSIRAYKAKQLVNDGRKYLVAPVVMMVEGVHHGSGGPIFYSAEELSRFYASWDGRPVPVRHPERNGELVSANSPDVHENEVIGKLFHTNFEDGKLKSEVWIDIDAANSRYPEVLKAIQNGDMMEVSTGLFSDMVEGEGTWNEETYTAEAINIRPDHLALLPDQTGACSVEDGCGLRANSKGAIQAMNDHELTLFAQRYKFLTNENVASYKDALFALSQIVDDMSTGSMFYYVEDITASSVVYCEMQYNREKEKYTRKYYQAQYSVSDGVYSIDESTAEHVVMARKTEWKKAKAEEESMPTNQKTPTTNEKETVPSANMTKEQAIQALTASGPLDVQDMQALFGKENANMMTAAMQVYSKQFTNLVQSLVNNHGLEEEFVKSMSMEHLEMLHNKFEAAKAQAQPQQAAQNDPSNLFPFLNHAGVNPAGLDITNTSDSEEDILAPIRK